MTRPTATARPRAGAAPARAPRRARRRAALGGAQAARPAAAPGRSCCGAVLAPVPIVLVIHGQSRPPKDTLFGRFATDNGFALALLVLGFAAQWVLPLLTAIVAGDIFASEDQHGTWKTVLTRSTSRAPAVLGQDAHRRRLRRPGAGAARPPPPSPSALLIVGHQPLIGPDRADHRPGTALRLVAASWAHHAAAHCSAFTCLAILLSVWSRNPAVGIAAPVVHRHGHAARRRARRHRGRAPVPAHHALRGLARPARRAPRSPARSSSGARHQRRLVRRWPWPPRSSSSAVATSPEAEPMRRTLITVLAALARPRRPAARRRWPPAAAARSPAPASSARCPPSFAQPLRPAGRDSWATTASRPRSLHAKAMCDKHGPDVADVGPGGDWICLMSWTDPQRPDAARGLRQVRAQRAQQRLLHRRRPEQADRLPTITDTQGRRGHQPGLRVRRLLRPRQQRHRRPASSFPSLLSVTSTTAAPDAQGRTGGPAQLRHRRRRLRRHRGRDGGGHPPRLGARSASRRRRPRRCGSRRRSRRGANEVTFTVRPTTGAGPSSPSTLPVEGAPGAA